MFVRKSTYQKVVDELEKLKNKPIYQDIELAKEELKSTQKSIDDFIILKETHLVDIVKYKEDISNAQNELKAIEEKHYGEVSRVKEELLLLDERLKEYEYNIENISAIASVTQYVQIFDGYGSEKLKVLLDDNKNAQKVMIKADDYFEIISSLTFNNSESEGRKQQVKSGRFGLVAFNSKVDSILSKVKHSNFETARKQIVNYFSDINKYMESVNFIELTSQLLTLRLEELRILFEYHLVLQEEKDEQAYLAEQIREEQRAQKEFDTFIKAREKEEKSYQKALKEVEKALETSHGEEIGTMELKITELKARLLTATQEKERAMSQAQLTRSGHVYVISNKGSFGENVYKIGMTRRLEPMDRVKELGDASVPFIFDVHAIIKSDDAPTLEKKLHKLFSVHRLNKINNRKEFFKVSLNDIKKAVINLNCDVEFTMVAEAIEYHASLELVKTKQVY